MGFPRQEYWSGLPFPSLGDLPDPGTEPASSALAGGFFTTEPPRNPSVQPTTSTVKCFILQKLRLEGQALLREDFLPAPSFPVSSYQEAGECRA